MGNPETGTPKISNPEIRRFGRYEVVSELGRGAMGVVYQARDPQIDRLVAVKTVALSGQEPDEEKEFRLRFGHEAQAAGRLHHPGIVAIFDAGENPDNHDPYIVLEYVPGEALNRILAREKKLPLATALNLTAEIAEALDYAHAQGVVHRDIKPGNIMVTADGHAKIADFGIAKLNLAHFTIPGRLLGTPAYMAPEQLSGEAVDGRADLFSLGVILYAMVTGHSPFQGDSMTTVSFKVVNREPVAASALDLNLPPELDEVIARAMAKDREQRYQSGGEFAGDVRQLQSIFNPATTTASLVSSLPAGTRSVTRLGKTTHGAPGANPAAVMARARNVVVAAVRKAPFRDLVLGAMTVVMLIIAGVESKLFVTSPQVEIKSPAGPGSILAPASPSAVLSNSVNAAPSAAPAAATPRKSHAAAPHAIKQDVKQDAPRQIVVPLSTLDLAVQHQFKDATLYVWVDDKLVLTRPLHGATEKKLVVFSGVRGVDSETLNIPAGKHVLRLRTLSADHAIDLSRTISADFIGGGDKSLQVTFDKRNSGMHLAWQ
jgi:eukaryotic-like serine/threonine-protein kinase